MATFSFGSNTGGFGTANKGFAFGSNTSTANTGFTGFGTSTATSGGLNFGASTSTAATSTAGTSSFGFGGAATNTGVAAPAQGFSFGASKPAATGGFSFGSGTNTGFGTGTNTGFGTGTNTAFGTGTSTAFGTGTATGFGTGTSTAFGTGTNTVFGTGANTGFGTGTNTAFGTGTNTAFGTGTNTGFGTGTNTAFGTGTNTAFGAGTTTGFGTGTNTGFGTGTNTGFGTGTNTGFGAGTTAFGTGTNTGFGTGTNTGFGTGTNTGFGAGTNTGFGLGSNTGGLFGIARPAQPLQTGFGLGTNNAFKGFGQVQQPQQGVVTTLCPSVSLYLAVCAPAYFNDERDEVLKKWNQLQAVWGSGKGYFAPGVPAVDFTPDNEFCRFKAVGYIKMPTFSPEEGLVELVIAKKDSIVREQQAGLVGELCKLYGGAVQICVEYVKPGPGDNKTRLCFYVQHRNANGETKKANTWDVYNHLKNDQHRQTINNLCIENATPLVALTESQLKEYLERPPRGLDPVIWSQGKRDNPDPMKYLPVPLVGFQELQARFKAQETESTLLQGQIDRIAEDVCSVQSRQATLNDQLAECNRKQKQMAHRVLQLLVRQECARKRGVPIDGNEEQLRIRLENLQSQLMAPTQYMGKVNELLSQMSAQGGVSSSSANGGTERAQLSSETEGDVKEFLSWQQDGISEVAAILKDDMNTFEAMIKSK
uniref:Nucleoporin p54 isoform X1 n=3 Tax=Hirondellea gigas TaxID=1518452 RepID=A0A6A7G474_9CRUS